MNGPSFVMVSIDMVIADREARLLTTGWPPLTYTAALTELSALYWLGRLPTISCTVMARSLGWSRNKLVKQIRRWTARGQLHFLEADNKRATERLPTWWPTQGPIADNATNESRTATSKESQADTATQGPPKDRSRTGHGHPRARSSSETERGETRDMDHDVRASAPQTAAPTLPLGQTGPPALLAIGALNLPPKVAERLVRGGVHAAGELTKMTRADVGKLRGIGRQALTDIEAALAEHGLAFKAGKTRGGMSDAERQALDVWCSAWRDTHDGKAYGYTHRAERRHLGPMGQLSTAELDQVVRRFLDAEMSGRPFFPPAEPPTIGKLARHLPALRNGGRPRVVADRRGSRGAYLDVLDQLDAEDDHAGGAAC